MPKPPPRWCEECGEEPRDKIHYPLKKFSGVWTCKRCSDNRERDRKEAAKHN